MSRIRRIAVIAASLLALSLTAAPSAPGAAALKRCSSKGVMAGPFFTSKLRARAVTCRTARAFVHEWGRTDDCVRPAGPRDDVCRIGTYRCVSRELGGEKSEVSRATCKQAGTRRAVSFNFGS